MPTEIVLVRHAESVRPAVGGPDEMTRPLTTKGLETAQALAVELLTLKPTAVLSSPYLRAVQTVEPTAQLAGLEVHTRWELREWDSGFGPTPDYAKYYAESWDELDFVRPNGESLRQMTNRAETVIRDIAELNPEGVSVIGSHGTFVSCSLAAFGLKMDWPFSRDMPSPAIYRLSLNSEGVATAIEGPGITGA